MLAIRGDLPRPSRRQFLVGAAAAGAGLTIGFHVPMGLASRALAADTINPINAYLQIDPDGTVTVLSAHMDGGQGIYTGIATLVAEELDADWSQLRVEGAAGNPKLYGNITWGGAVQGTGGSSSIPSSWERYRRAGAIARAMLVEAAAQEWGVPAGEVRVERGLISHASGKSARFGELADRAAGVTPRAQVKLKDPSAWVYIGNEKLRRLDSIAKTTGAQQFPIDVRLPGMLTAVLARPPLFGARAISFDAAAARRVKGVVDVVETPRGVAVVANDTWSAIKGREALTVEWDETGAETRGSADLMGQYKELARSGKVAVARNEGDVAGALSSAAQVLEAEFEFPYLAHAAMEPLDAVARFENGTLEIWAGHQMPDLYQQVGAQIMGIEPCAGEAARHDAWRFLRATRRPRRRRHRRGGERAQGDRRQGARQGPLDPRGRHEGWPVPPDVLSHDQGGARRRRQSGRLAAPDRRAVDPGGHAV